MSMKAKSSTQKLIFSAVFLAGLAVLAYYLYHYSFLSPINYAQEVAKPLEDGIVAAGGIKQCTSGDNGRGWDNRSPHYGATYYLKKNETEIAELINEISSRNGYHIKHATATDHGTLAIASEYADQWYFDETSKLLSFSDIEKQPIKLSFVVYDEGDNGECNQHAVGDGQRAVGIGIRLPSLK